MDEVNIIIIIFFFIYKGIKLSLRINTETQQNCIKLSASWITRHYRFQQTETLICFVNQQFQLHLIDLFFIFFFVRFLLTSKTPIVFFFSTPQQTNCDFDGTIQACWCKNVFCFLKSQCLKNMLKQNEKKKQTKITKQTANINWTKRGLEFTRLSPILSIPRYLHQTKL